MSRMSENTELLERLDHYADNIQRGVHVSGTQMRTLLLALHADQAALEAAREDAERYRWLRDEARTNRAPHIFQYPAQSFDHPQYPHFKDVGLDAAIDAAREARNG